MTGNVIDLSRWAAKNTTITVGRTRYGVDRITRLVVRAVRDFILPPTGPTPDSDVKGDCGRGADEECGLKDELQCVVHGVVEQDPALVDNPETEAPPKATNMWDFIARQVREPANAHELAQARAAVAAAEALPIDTESQRLQKAHALRIATLRLEQFE